MTTVGRVGVPLAGRERKRLAGLVVGAAANQQQIAGADLRAREGVGRARPVDVVLRAVLVVAGGRQIPGARGLEAFVLREERRHVAVGREDRVQGVDGGIVVVGVRPDHVVVADAVAVAIMIDREGRRARDGLIGRGGAGLGRLPGHGNGNDPRGKARGREDTEQWIQDRSMTQIASPRMHELIRFDGLS